MDNCDCLGCILQAKLSGEITEAEYDEIMAEWDAIEKMEATPCPSCGDMAYISMYDPTTAHCPECGMYSFQERITGEWIPFRLGTPKGRKGVH